MPVTIDENTALVLIDLQRGLAGRKTAPYPIADVFARAARLAEAFRDRGAPVVLVRVIAEQYPPEFGEIVDELAGHPEDLVITKRTWGAFHETGLDAQLRERGVTRIVLGGVATSIGVESTARAAHEHGYQLTMVTDAMSDVDAEAHRHSIERIFPRLGDIGDTEEILRALPTAR